MSSLLERARGLEAALDRFLERRPGFTRALVRYGWVLLAGIAALSVIGAATAGGSGQYLIYATKDGSLVSMDVGSGESTVVYEGSREGYATGPSRSDGSRSVAFTVLRGVGDLRGDLYIADLARGTRALTLRAEPGEAFLYPDFSYDRTMILASRYSGGSPPNVVTLPASGAADGLLEPASPDAPGILGPAWATGQALYAWRMEKPGELTLTVYDLLEHRQAAVRSYKAQVGIPAYYADANTLIFDERPRGAGSESSRVELSVGTGRLEISGEGALALYDPSPPVPALDYKIAAVWTDGEKAGLGLLDPDGWSFEKTGITLEPGSRSPRVSLDGAYVATTSADGGELTVRSMRDGSVVRRIRDLQPAGTALDRLRGAGFEVPEEARWFAPSNFSWRSF